MALGWTRSRTSPIAVDFGADRLKLLQLEGVHPPRVVAAAARRVPEAARRDPAARQAFFADALRELLKTQPFRGKRAVCAIPAYQTLIQHLQLPRGDAADALAQVELHLRTRMGLDPSRMIIRHHEVAPIVCDGQQRREVVFMAASKEAVMRHMQTCHHARLEVAGIHTEPTVLIKAFEHLWRRPEFVESSTCVIDIGAATTKVVVARGGAVTFAKTIHAAADHLTRQHARAAKVSFDEARVARMTAEARGARGERSGPGATAVTESSSRELAPFDARAARLAQAEAEPETLECLTDELRTCLRYHHSVFPQWSVDRLLFVGGEARNASTCRGIAQALRIAAQAGDPLARTHRVGRVSDSVDLAEPQPGWAIPVGLALMDTQD